ncbi:hypothetical protein EKD04_005355 [Chloroflexales bacterium ZM16-3]|nr:hypothetical protein [Chloroflexales bacterium ZM16-3]
MVKSRPRLCYLLGVCAWQRGVADEASDWLQRAAAGFVALGDIVGQGEALIDLGIPLIWRGELTKGLEITRQALELPLLPCSRPSSRATCPRPSRCR